MNRLLIGKPCLKVYKIIEKKRSNKVLEKKNRNFCNKNSSLDQYEQLLWTEIYRPKTSQTYLGNHTRQIKRLNEWLFYWTKKLRNEQPKKILQKKRKRFADDDDDEDFTDNSSKYLEKKKPIYSVNILSYSIRSLID